MMKRHRIKTILCSMAAVISLGCFGNAQGATRLNLSKAPLFLAGSAPPLALLVMGRDHKLYYEAYNDASDLDGDGTIEIGYKPAHINYYGYFDSYKCYLYDSSNKRFEPNSTTNDKTCSNAWSGDFLNYLTTSRMDALRKVLYGGYRVTDTASETVLAGAFIPQDAHSWGKEYISYGVDGYYISEYAPLPEPTNRARHFFAATSLADGATPVLRVLQNQPGGTGGSGGSGDCGSGSGDGDGDGDEDEDEDEDSDGGDGGGNCGSGGSGGNGGSGPSRGDNGRHIWEWVSKEKPVADNSLGIPTDYQIQVVACDSSMLEKNCQLYGSSSYKPTGLLQEYGENDSMYFGLLTGSYAKNMSGGVLRKNVGSITDEINPDTGEFDTATNTNGIINTIDSLRIVQFDYSSHVYDPDSNPNYDPDGWITTRPMREGEQPDWGNPIAEMMYEGLRYFAGRKSPTSAYSISTSDANLGLPVATWEDPFASSNFPQCSKPFQIVISDINPSYDTDQLPGSYFSSFSGDVSGLNCQALADTISSHEPEVAGRHFIGQSGTVADGAPSEKGVTSLGNIRGLSPEEPTKKGGYYSASVAYFGHINDLHSDKDGEQKLSTFSVALASPLPRIEIPVNGQTVTLVPFAKSVGGCLGISGAGGDFQPTNQIVDFYAEKVTPAYGKFRINYEDVEQGADHDMDAIVEYEYQVNSDGTVSIALKSTYASGCIVQHVGYMISGTTADGTYLEVRDKDTGESTDPDYFLDTPPGATPGNGWQDTTALPLSTTRTFTPGNTSAATLLKDPLWYAAKWGSFNDRNDDGIPQKTEWDINNDNTPDNYFLVTSPLALKDQLSKAFDEITEQTSSGSPVALNTGFISSNSHLYQARFVSGTWTGQLVDFPINSDGSLGVKSWEAAELLDQVSSDNRKIVTYKPSRGIGIPFRWPANPASPTASELDVAQSNALATDPATNTLDSKGSDRLNYIRGADISGFRSRIHKLGDIIQSSPIYVGTAPEYRYPDTLATASYSTFKSTTTRDAMVYVGANDGMLHAFDAVTGEERFAYVPNAIIKDLNQLSDPNYSHRYYVDGTPTVVDAFFDSDGDGSDQWLTLLAGGLRGGGQGIFALDVTTPPDASTIESSLASKVLWEFTDADDPDLGYTYSEPNIIRMHNGKWAVVFGNGYNNTENDGNTSTTGNAVLYIVNAETGALIKKIDTGAGFADDPTIGNRPNGLATVTPIDADGDFIVDYIYGGDLFGNLWKFDVTSATESQWKIAYGNSVNPKPLFTTQAADGKSYQPITTRPQVGRHPAKPNTFMVYFGTGKYLETDDDSQTGQTTQTFYGIWDKNDPASFTSFTRDNLLQQKILKEIGQSFDTDGNGFADTTSEFRVTTEKPIDWGTHQGWYLDLINTDGGNTNNYGEKQVTDSILRNGRIIFAPMIPSDALCDFGGTSWLMELDAASGARLPFSPFDSNRNGVFGRSDYVNAGDTDGDGEDNYVPAGGRKSKVGIISTPSIISGIGNDPMHEYKYASGSTGKIEVIHENAGFGYSGRLSWIQLR